MKASRYYYVFIRVEELLNKYKKHPSISIRNHIGLEMMPYINYRCRYESIALDLWDWQDWAHDCYLALLKAVEYAIAASNPVGYIIKTVKLFVMRRAAKTFKTYNLRLGANLGECSEYLAIKLNFFYQLLPQEDELNLDEIILEEVYKLSDTHREIFYLVAMRGLSQSEVARQLDLSPRTLGRRYSEAKQKLKESLRSNEYFRNYEALPDKRKHAVRLKLQGLENRIIAQRLEMDSSVLSSLFYNHCPPVK